MRKSEGKRQAQRDEQRKQKTEREETEKRKTLLAMSGILYNAEERMAVSNRPPPKKYPRYRNTSSANSISELRTHCGNVVCHSFERE